MFGTMALMQVLLDLRLGWPLFAAFVLQFVISSCVPPVLDNISMELEYITSHINLDKADAHALLNVDTERPVNLKEHCGISYGRHRGMSVYGWAFFNFAMGLI